MNEPHHPSEWPKTLRGPSWELVNYSSVRKPSYFNSDGRKTPPRNTRLNGTDIEEAEIKRSPSKRVPADDEEFDLKYEFKRLYLLNKDLKNSLKDLEGEVEQLRLENHRLRKNLEMIGPRFQENKEEMYEQEPERMRNEPQWNEADQIIEQLKSENDSLRRRNLELQGSIASLMNKDSEDLNELKLELQRGREKAAENQKTISDLTTRLQQADLECRELKSRLKYPATSNVYPQKYMSVGGESAFTGSDLIFDGTGLNHSLAWQVDKLEKELKIAREKLTRQEENRSKLWETNQQSKKELLEASAQIEKLRKLVTELSQITGTLPSGGLSENKTYSSSPRKNEYSCCHCHCHCHCSSRLNETPREEAERVLREIKMRREEIGGPDLRDKVHDQRREVAQLEHQLQDLQWKIQDQSNKLRMNS